jgi:chemotaxis signal transduction protein
MILLPRGNPVKEKIDPGRINLPDALRKLRSGSFSGYLRFDAASATGIIIFEQGRLISALYEEGESRQIAVAALARIFALSLEGGTNLDIFRLSSDLALSIYTLLHGHLLYRGQEIKLIDIKALLGQMKAEQLSGCLRIYTQEHIALIFYRQGNPLGFFHDGSTDLETTADTSMSVARLPGAKIDVLTTTADEEEVLVDLLESVDISKLWNSEVEKIASQRLQSAEAEQRSKVSQENERRDKLLQLFCAAAVAQLGKIGVSLVEKEFEKVSALNDGTLAQFYAAIARSAKLVAGPSRIELMLADMRHAVRSVLTPS